MPKRTRNRSTQAAALPASPYGVIRHPQEWVRDDHIRTAALNAGWDKIPAIKGSQSIAAGNLALLEAIMATESGGDPIAYSGDACVALTQFNPKNKTGIENNYSTDVMGALKASGLQPPKTRADWFSDPRTAVIYTGFVLRNGFEMLDARAITVGHGKHAHKVAVTGAMHKNLFMALQGYNGGNDDLVTPAATNGQSRNYPELIGGYLSYQSKHSMPEATRAPYADMLQRLRDDAERVGQLKRLNNGITEFEHRGAHAKSDGGHRRFGQHTGEVITAPSQYLIDLHGGKVPDAPPVQVKPEPVQQVKPAPHTGNPPPVQAGGQNRAQMFQEFRAAYLKAAELTRGLDPEKDALEISYRMTHNPQIVAALRHALAQQGYSVGAAAPNGSFGNGTRAAFSDFIGDHRNDKGIKVNDYMSLTEVISILNHGLPPKPPPNKQRT